MEIIFLFLCFWVGDPDLCPKGFVPVSDVHYTVSSQLLEVMIKMRERERAQCKLLVLLRGAVSIDILSISSPLLSYSRKVSSGIVFLLSRFLPETDYAFTRTFNHMLLLYCLQIAHSRLRTHEVYCFNHGHSSSRILRLERYADSCPLLLLSSSGHHPQISIRPVVAT